MVVVRIIVKIVLLPVRICLTMIQLVVMFFTWLSATVFHILSGIICITAVLGYGFGQETGTEAVRMLVAGFILYPADRARHKRLYCLGQSRLPPVPHIPHRPVLGRGVLLTDYGIGAFG